MAKYSTELKIKVVKKYLESNISYKPLVDKYDISKTTVIRTWVNAYKSQGYERLKAKKRGRPSKMPKSQKRLKETKVNLSTNLTKLGNDSLTEALLK